MKKKFLIFTFGLFLLTSNAQANTDTIKVMSLEQFSTQNPSSDYKVQTIEREKLSDGTFLETGTIISGHVVRVKPPKRLKRNGYFEFVPDTFSYDGETQIIEKSDMIAKVVGYKPIDPKELAFSAVKTAAGFAVKGATQGISFVEGVAQAENGDRLKSGFINVYKDSPLSYLEVGSELNVNVGDILILKLKKIR